MLRHRYIVVIFIVLMVLPFMVDYFATASIFYFVPLVLIFLGIEFYGAYFIHSNFHLKAICIGKTNQKKIALTFDDGPSQDTRAILDILKAYQIPATFFCIGEKIEAQKDELKRMDAEGHCIGNHSYSHSFFFDFNFTKGFVKELIKTNSAIKEVIGKTPNFFRPPYGVTTPALARAVKKLNLLTIGWNVRSLDTSIKDKTKVLQRIKSRLKPGSIILLHDTIKDNETLLKELLDYLKEQKYQVVSLETLLQKKAYV